ncbi:MAG TPA: NlpC/P60 family protein [Streptosporangiaceae bacterium]|nr:NlpC/P60 family protein [Streptosporangiaceae bacterium]
MTRAPGPGHRGGGWAAIGRAATGRYSVRARPGRFGPPGVPGGSGGRGPLFGLLIGACVVAFAVGLTVIPIAMSGDLVGLPAFAPQQSCTQPAGQLVASTQAKDSIPANYLTAYQKAARQYGIQWQVLAGIGEVESDHGRANMPGVGHGQNGFGAAGPMQIGIGGAAGDEWGGPAVHAASQAFGGVATDGDGDGIANVYDPADAIPAAAKYLLAHGAPGDLPTAIFAYNHLESYVQDVLSWAGKYTKGGFTVGAVNLDSGASCVDSITAAVPNQVVAAAISYAKQQLGKAYVFGSQGPDTFDCSGLTMMAYRAGGTSIPRTSEAQWSFGPQIQAGSEQPGDLVFFVGDPIDPPPGHVGMVLGNGMMIEAEQAGVPVHIVSYKDRGPIFGFSRPWAHAGIVLPG